MQGYQNNDDTSKPKFRVIKGYAPAGQYKAMCERAANVMRYYKDIAEFCYTVSDGNYAGLSLRGWVPIASREYRQYCEIALDRELDDEEEPPDPSIFVGKVFIVEARYQKTDGKSLEELDPTKKKGSWDELRASKIISLVKS